MSDKKASAQEALTTAAKVLQGVAKPLIAAVSFALPLMIQFSVVAHGFFSKLPKNAVQFLIGCVFCFFGGLYPVLFAAVQAAGHGGMTTVSKAMGDLGEEAMIIIEESKKDDKRDDDKDGKADVDQLEGKELLLRKFKLVMAKMNPEKVDKALGSLYSVWLAVAAVLAIQFARTIAMALAISDFLKKPMHRFVAPTINLATPKEYQKWVPVVLGWITKAIAMSIAWYVQTVISAFTSALTGGLMMARAAYKFCVARGWTLGGLIPKDDSDSVVDEGLSYLFAAGGFYFQFKLGFSLPAPFNWLLWPFELAEYYLRWTITKAT